MTRLRESTQCTVEREIFREGGDSVRPVEMRVVRNWYPEEEGPGRPSGCGDGAAATPDVRTEEATDAAVVGTPEVPIDGAPDILAEGAPGELDVEGTLASLARTVRVNGSRAQPGVSLIDRVCANRGGAGTNPGGRVGVAAGDPTGDPAGDVGGGPAGDLAGDLTGFGGTAAVRTRSPPDLVTG